MSFSRYKTLIGLLKRSERNSEFNLRFYSGKVIFSSASPHETRIKPKKLFGREPTSRSTKIDYKIGDNTFNQDELTLQRQGNQRARFEHNRKTRRAQTFASITNEIENNRSDGIYRSNSPVSDIQNTNQMSHEVQIKHEKLFKRGKNNNEVLPRINYKISDNPQYQNEFKLEADPVTVNFGHNKERSKSRKLTYLTDEIEDDESDEVYRFNSHDADIENTDDDPNYQTETKLKKIETPEGIITLNLSEDEFDLNEFMREFRQVPGPLDECKENLSDFGSAFSPTFNFAAYADDSKLIQEYVKLGVKLYKVEKNMDHMRALLNVDLEKGLPVYIQFLHDCGVPADCLGDVITENPMLLQEDMDDMKTRIRYLKAHKFTAPSIARIITKNPTWLTWATKCIDERLGHFQNEFKLQGAEVRFLATKQPKLITYKMKHIHENTFAVREEMGFNKHEIKVLLLSKPRIWMNSRRKIVDSFDYLHNTMQLSHLTIASQPDLLACRKSRIQNRHEFLVELKKVQYDPKKPGYIAPSSIIMGSDVDFCTKIAKTAVDTYNLFLKTR